MSVVSRAEVVEVKIYKDDVREFILSVDHYDNFEAGQFLQLTLDKVTASTNWPESRTFSIASYLNDDKKIRLLIKRNGKFTNRIFEELEVGKECYIKYAYGDFLLPLFDQEEKIHCIAGGTGVAPFLSFIECLSKEGGLERLFLYYSVRHQSEFVNLSNIRLKLPATNFFPFCTRENSVIAQNRHIKIEDIMVNVNGIKDEHFYICGSKDFISYFKTELENRGVCNIYLDEWD